jgi:DNA-binding response OmpR family regulator
LEGGEMKQHNLKILIVEDESLLALELAMSIKSYGYNIVDYVTTPADAKKILQEQSPELILMDINLNNKIDGIELYRSFETTAQVIYLTAYIDDATVTKAISTHPLGYLVKPHNESELQALLKLAQLKKGLLEQKENHLIKLPHDYIFDTHQEKLFHKENFIKLGTKKLQLFKMLIEAKGAFVSFKEIEDELYKDNPPSASSIRTLIYRLRNQLESDMIENELNYGIRLVFLNSEDPSPDTCGT